MQNNDISKEELQAELDAMEAQGKHHTPRKSINRQVKSHVSVKKISLIVLGLTLLLTLFVWISSVAGSINADGYIIRIRDTENIFGDRGDGAGQAPQLELGFDPTFDEKYMDLVGLGYGGVSDLKGGSLFANLEMNTTMFDKFKDFAESNEAASVYDGNKGQANFDQYYCNKYYLKNEGNATANYRLNIEISENLKDALHAARIMIVTGDEISGYNYQIFATANRATGKKEVAAFKEYRTATSNYQYFIDPNVNINQTGSESIDDAWLCDYLIEDEETGYYHYYSCQRKDNGEIIDGSMYQLEPGESVCYTICIWFEGSDPDHNNSIIGGGITFSINYETEEYLEYLYKTKKEEKK